MFNKGKGGRGEINTGTPPGALSSPNPPPPQTLPEGGVYPIFSNPAVYRIQIKKLQ